MYRISIGEQAKDTTIHDLATGERISRIVGLDFSRRGPDGTFKAIVASHVRGVQVELPESLRDHDALLDGGRISLRELNLYPGVHLNWAALQ